MSRSIWAALCALSLASCGGGGDSDEGNACGEAEQAVRAEADHHRACQVDADCALYTVSLDCVSGCAVAVAKSALPTLEEAAQRVNHDYCDDAMCRISATCIVGHAACRAQRCEFVPGAR